MLRSIPSWDIEISNRKQQKGPSLDSRSPYQMRLDMSVVARAACPPPFQPIAKLSADEQIKAVPSANPVLIR